MTKTLIFVSDLHCNSTVAICPPETELDDGDIHVASKHQLWLWGNWLKLIDKVRQINNEKILVVNGDAIEGDVKKRSFQIISENPSDMINMAYNTLEPLARECDSIFFTRGTGSAHGGNSNYLEEMLSLRFGDAVQKCPETGKGTHWKLRLLIDKVRFDIQHHGRMGQLPWTQHGYTLRLAAELIYLYAKEKEPLPDLAIRSHQHRWSDSYDNEPVRVIYTPAWQLATEFIHRISQSSIAHIGALLVHVDGNKYETDKIKFKPENRKWITLNSQQKLQQKKSSANSKKGFRIGTLFRKER